MKDKKNMAKVITKTKGKYGLVPMPPPIMNGGGGTKGIVPLPPPKPPRKNK